MAELHEMEMRAVYADTLIELMKENDKIVCVEADLGRATGTYPKVHDAFPGRFIDVGVAESNLIGISAGLANDGKIPFCASFTPFATRRAYDQITISVAYSNNNVKIVGTSPGISATMNGGTHMCMQDLAIMRAMPNMEVYSPADSYEVRAIVKYMASVKKPMYLQLLREKYGKIFDANVTFDPKKARIVKEGTDVTLVATGLGTQFAFKALSLLADKGVSAELLHYPSVKPFDADTLVASAKKTNAVVVVDNGSVIGGLGGAVCEVLSEKYPVRVTRLGAQDRFGEVGTLDYLADIIGISPAKIADACVAAKKAK
ncbi:MAG TPA: transketolase C-terminal domain-containing protein [Spirochaetota bacterium]|nr:transketolase C-terminal domain-containing protein [Spirochaetota bacterium]